MADDSITQGGFDLGELLAGGRPQDPAKALAIEGAVYRNASALEQARIDRAKAIAAVALPDAIRAHPQLGGVNGDVNAAFAGMNPNLSVLTEGNLKLGELGLQTQRIQALEAGDVKTHNRLADAQAGRAHQPTVALGGAYMENGANVMLGDEYIPTLPTMTAQQRADASIQQGERRTDAAVARSGRTGNSGGTSKPAKQSDVILQQARDAIAGGASKEAVVQRLKDRGYSKLAKEL
jgi:hypothetical protein